MIRLSTLGTIDLVAADGRTLQSILSQPKRVALLAYLAAADETAPRRRDTLLGVFWPDLDQEHARHALNQSIYILRRALGRDVLRSQGEEIGVERDQLWCDVHAFGRALRDDRPRDALDLYRGDLLGGFFISDAPDFEHWLDSARSRLRGQAAGAAWSLAEREAARGDFRDASEWAKLATDLQPHDEPAFRRYLTLLDRAGKRVAAISAFEDFGNQLRGQLGIEPSPETLEVVELIRSSAARSEPDTASPANGGTTVVRMRKPASPEPALRRPRREAVAVRTNATGPAVSVATDAIESIAVLPFTDLSPDGDQQYFGDGMAEELISALTGLEGLRVAARTSSFQFKGSQADVREIGRKLGVETVLEGSVRKSGARLRITAQLVSARDGFHLWSETYDRDMEDVFAVQDEIAGSIAAQVGELVGPEPAGVGAPLVRRHTENVEAYQLYLKGRYLWSKRTSEALLSGIEYFERAIAIDSTYALAYAGLADSYSLLGWYRFLPTADAFERTKWAARTAVEIDDTLAEAYTSLAYAEFLHDWDWSGAKRDFERAIQLNPSYPTVRHFYAEYLMAMGRFEDAHEQMSIGHRLDPLALSIATGVGWTLYYLERYEEAIEQYHSVMTLDPHFVILPWFLGPAYAQAGRHDEAIELYETWIERSRHPGLIAHLVHALALSGRREEAQARRAELEGRAQEEPVPADYLALVYAALGEPELACDALERAIEERCWTLVFLRVDPSLASLHGQPRFDAILDRLRL